MMEKIRRLVIEIYEFENLEVNTEYIFKLFSAGLESGLRLGNKTRQQKGRQLTFYLRLASLIQY